MDPHHKLARTLLYGRRTTLDDVLGQGLDAELMGLDATTPLDFLAVVCKRAMACGRRWKECVASLFPYRVCDIVLEDTERDRVNTKFTFAVHTEVPDMHVDSSEVWEALTEQFGEGSFRTYATPGLRITPEQRRRISLEVFHPTFAKPLELLRADLEACLLLWYPELSFGFALSTDGLRVEVTGVDCAVEIDPGRRIRLKQAGYD